MAAGGQHLIVHVLTRLLKGGSEENTLYACRAQVASGHRVLLIHGCDFDEESAALARTICEVRQVSALVHPVSALNDVRATWELARLFASVRPDVVHTHQSKAGIVGRLAAKI